MITKTKLNSKKWSIIGGGMLGLMVAHRLRQQGFQVTLYEAAPEIGGLAGAWQVGDYTWDRFYHVILLSDTFTRSLIEEIGLAQSLVWRETKTGFYTDGQFYSMSNMFEFLKFPPLNLLDKFRLGLTILYASHVKKWKKLEKISVERWLRRWSGDRTFEKIWLPLLKSKLGENYKNTSAAFIWATIQRMYAARNSGIKKEMFGYVKGGYATILKQFIACLKDEGVTIKTGYAVDKITPGDDFSIQFTNGEIKQSDRVVVTTSSNIAAKLCESFSYSEKKLLDDIQYLGIVCPSLLLKKPLSRFYVTNITDNWVPFTGVIEMTAIVDQTYFGNNALVYLPKYVQPDHKLFDAPEEAIRSKFFEGLQQMYPDLSDDDVTFFGVSKARNVFALPTINYSQKLPPVITSVPGLYLLNSAHIINGTLNVNESLQLVDNQLPEILSNSDQLEVN